MEKVVDKSNQYWVIAENDFIYLQHSLKDVDSVSYLNPIDVQCVQVAEKYIKAVLLNVNNIDKEYLAKLLHSHSLVTLYSEVKNNYEFKSTLKIRDLKFLSDMYFDARYHGDNYINVNKETLLECVDVAESVRLTCLSLLQEEICELDLESVNSDLNNKAVNRTSLFNK